MVPTSGLSVPISTRSADAQALMVQSGWTRLAVDIRPAMGQTAPERPEIEAKHLVPLRRLEQEKATSSSGRLRIDAASPGRE
jgi:hypothetical protein